MKAYRYLFLVLLLAISQSLYAQPSQKQRVIVLTDIEADPDDTMSLVRLLLYSGEIDIKGLVATTSCWKRTSVAPESIKKVIHAYGQVQPNLVKHEASFPKAEKLLAVVKSGLPKYGMLGVGDGKDSQGSDWIIKVLEEKDERPLWISVWGGVNTLAQSLHKIKATKSATEAERLIAKLRVYTISDQDDAGIWIRNNFPNLFYIVNPGDHYGSATWSAINMVVKGINNDEISNTWLAKNIQQGHGPLGAVYPDVAWGMEGDTPSYLSLIPNGLNAPEHPDWGGWGGRYELYKPELDLQKLGDSGVPHDPETRKIWTSAVDKYFPFTFPEYGRAVGKSSVSFEDNKVTLWRWRVDLQNDFAARMAWCLKPYREANHAPVAVINGPEEITVKSGGGIGLDASGSTDPDGDSLSFLWFIYAEAGSYKGEIKFQPENAHGVYLVAPEVTKMETLHLILKVTDKGTPPLSSYKRVIIHVSPK